MFEKTDVPFQTGKGGVMLEGVGLTLGEFDEFAVGYSGGRSGLGEMVGVELEKAVAHMRITADDDMFAALAA